MKSLPYLHVCLLCTKILIVILFRSNRKLLNEFRVLNLICNNFNEVYSLTIIPSLKYAISLFGMLCFYAANPGNELCIYGVSTIGCFGSALLLANVTSAVWNITGKFLADTDYCIGRIQSKDRRLQQLRKLMKSMNPLRICVGGFYYMEKEAKLAISINFL